MEVPDEAMYLRQTGGWYIIYFIWRGGAEGVAVLR
jgi:hypothetical protein